MVPSLFSNYTFSLGVTSPVVNLVVLERLEALTNPVERFAFFRANKERIYAEFQKRQLAERRARKEHTRTDLERWLSKGVASANEVAQVLKLSASMLSQVRAGTRCLSSENTQLLKLLTK